EFLHRAIGPLLRHVEWIERIRRRERQRQRDMSVRITASPRCPNVRERHSGWPLAPTAMTMRTHFIFYQTRLMRIGLPESFWLSRWLMMVWPTITRPPVRKIRPPVS